MSDFDLPRRVGIGLMCTLVAVSGLWFIAAGERHFTVTLTVESVTRLVSTQAPTVGHLLADEKVTVSPSDLVVPPTTAPVIEGLRVEVRRARHVDLLLDGRPVMITTVERDVGEMLAKAEIAVPEGSLLAPPEDTPIVDGLEVTLRRPSLVVVRHDNSERVVSTLAPTVRDMLSELGVDYTNDDSIEPALDIVPERGLKVTVSRAGVHEYTVNEPVPPPVEIRQDPDLYLGQEEVLDPGRDGRAERVYRTTVRSGKLEKREVLSEVYFTHPVPRVVAHGTKAYPVVAEAAPPTGAIEARMQEGGASWYHRVGLTAAHQWLPFGTAVKVTDLATGKSVTVTVDDRGPYVAGRIIDLSDGAFAALADLGAGVLNVRIEW